MVTSSEFLLLQAYLDEEWNERTKQDYYLAQIATVIERFHVGFQDNPPDIQIEDKLIPFGTRKELNPEKDEEEVPVQEVDWDKMFWLTRLGIQTEDGKA